MTIERRLHHAARELRELEIDVPPLTAPRRRQPSLVLQAMAAPMLFVAGGLFAYGALQTTTDPTVPLDVGDIVADTDEPASPGAGAGTGTGDEVRDMLAPSATAEREMIDRLIDSVLPTDEPPARPAQTEPTSVSLRTGGPT